MKLGELKGVQKKLLAFVEEFKNCLGRKERIQWCHYYISGLLLEGERKSIQPMAERLPGGNEQCSGQVKIDNLFKRICAQTASV